MVKKNDVSKLCKELAVQAYVTFATCQMDLCLEGELLIGWRVYRMMLSVSIGITGANIKGIFEFTSKIILRGCESV